MKDLYTFLENLPAKLFHKILIVANVYSSFFSTNTQQENILNNTHKLKQKYFLESGYFREKDQLPLEKRTKLNLHTEDVLEIFWTFYVRPVCVLSTRSPREENETRLFIQHN